MKKFLDVVLDQMFCWKSFLKYLCHKEQGALELQVKQATS